MEEYRIKIDHYIDNQLRGSNYAILTPKEYEALVQYLVGGKAMNEHCKEIDIFEQE